MNCHPHSTRRHIAMFAAVLMSLGGTKAFSRDEPARPDPAKLAASVKDILRSRCLDCHGGNSTQGDIAVLDRDLLIKKAVVPGKPDESPLYLAITETDEDARMPEGLPALSAGEIETIRQWILAGAPAYPPDVVQPEEANKDKNFRSVEGVEYVLKEILARQRTLSPDARRFTRYFSSHHLLLAGATRDLLEAQRNAFVKAVNHLSREREIVRPVVINGDMGTVFAIDIRKAGRQKRPFQSIADGKSTADSANLYDLSAARIPVRDSLRGVEGLRCSGDRIHRPGRLDATGALCPYGLVLFRRDTAAALSRRAMFGWSIIASACRSASNLASTPFEFMSLPLRNLPSSAVAEDLLSVEERDRNDVLQLMVDVPNVQMNRNTTHRLTDEVVFWRTRNER